MIAKDEKIHSLTFKYAFEMLFPVFKDYLPKFLLGLGFILLTTLLEISLPIVVGQSVDIAIQRNGEKSYFMSVCLLFLLLILVKAVSESLQAFVIQSTGQKVLHDLRGLLFSHIERLPISYFDKNPSGRLLTRVINDIKALSELFTASISVLVLDGFIISGTVVAMFLLHWKLALIVLSTFPGVLFVIHFYGKRLAGAYREVRRKLSDINSFLGENIGGILTIQRLSAENERLSRFREIVSLHETSQLESTRVFASVQPYANVLNGVAMGSLLLMGGYWVIHGETTIGVLVTFLGYIRNLYQPIRDLVEKYNTFLAAVVSLERVVSILNEPVEKSNEMVSRGQDHFRSIEFRKVRFRYPTKEEDALNDVSICLREGESLAIVGATGSGKSTLVRLLLKFYEPQGGEIYFGGKNVSDWNLHLLRREIGVIHQEIYLFRGALRDNLSLGRSFSDDFLKSQCERVHFWDEVKDRGGLDLEIYEGGSNLSTGQKQLLSFVRLLIFDPPVLILDEATSSIDRKTERKLLESIPEIVKGRTSMVIAHRISTIFSCHRILVLDEGRVAEEGSVEELLKRDGIFKKFFDIHHSSPA